MKPEIEKKSSDKNNPQRDRRVLFVFFAILFMGFFLRLINLGEKSLWLDESLGILFAQNPIARFFDLLRMDVHPPLYFLVLKLLLLFSANPVFLRIFSVICGTAGLAVIYPAFKRRGERNTVFLCLFFLALSPLAIHYSQEIRMYALFFLLGNLTLWSALRFAEKSEFQPFVVFSVCSAIILYVHYFAGVFVAGCLFFIAWERMREHKNVLQGLREAFHTALLIVILYIPWISTFLRHFSSASMGGKHSQSHIAHFSRNLAEYFTQMFGGVMAWAPLEKILLFRTNPYHLGSLGWILFFVFILFFLVRGIYESRKEGRFFRALVSVMGAGFILTFIHLAFKGRFYSRCFIIFLPALFYMLARGILSMKMKILRVGAMVYFSICLLFPAIFYLSVDMRDVSLPLSRLLSEATAKQEPILHTGKFSYFPQKIYLPEKKQYLADTPLLLMQERWLAGKELMENVDSLGNCPRIWLVIEYWGAPSAWDDVEYWEGRFFGSDWRLVPVTSLNMGVKKCTVYTCERKNATTEP